MATINIPKGRSYSQRVQRVHEIYDQYKRSGLSNREIWKRYIYPEMGICEGTFYRIAKVNPDKHKCNETINPNQLTIFSE